MSFSTLLLNDSANDACPATSRTDYAADTLPVADLPLDGSSQSEVGGASEEADGASGKGSSPVLERVDDWVNHHSEETINDVEPHPPDPNTTDSVMPSSRRAEVPPNITEQPTIEPLKKTRVLPLSILVMAGDRVEPVEKAGRKGTSRQGDKPKERAKVKQEISTTSGAKPRETTTEERRKGNTALDKSTNSKTKPVTKTSDDGIDDEDTEWLRSHTSMGHGGNEISEANSNTRKKAADQGEASVAPKKARKSKKKSWESDGSGDEGEDMKDFVVSDKDESEEDERPVSKPKRGSKDEKGKTRRRLRSNEDSDEEFVPEEDEDEDEEKEPDDEDSADDDSATKKTGNQKETSRNAGKRKRERCWYGKKCYRRNPAHKAEFSHPEDADW